MFRHLLYSAFGCLGSAETNAFMQATGAPAKAQARTLMQILRRNANSAYGREHGFGTINTVLDFQKAVPINEYEQLEPYIERAARGEANVLTEGTPFMFASTSGTTGARKLIPITRDYVKEFRRASVVSGYHLLKHFPGVANGVSLSVFSPAEEARTEGDIPIGAISGRLYLEEPALIRKFISPIPYDVFLIGDYESRYYTLLRCALMLPVSSIYTLNPSTIVLLARRLQTYGESLIADIRAGTLSAPGPIGDSIRSKLSSFCVPNRQRADELEALWEEGRFRADNVWPDLSLICCWTRAAAAFYLKDIPELYGSVPVCDITYGASEGRGTVLIGRSEQALALRSHFFEFVPESEMKGSNPRALLAEDLQLGESYYILFTTSSGLYRYNINDIVKVVGWINRTPLLEFQHKGGNISSFTGEKVTESQVTNAVSALVASQGINLRFFTVIPEFRPQPHYQIWIESEDRVFNEAEFLADVSSRFDEQLGLANIEYKTKRESHRLAPPVGRLLPVGTYDSLRRQLVGQGVPDAQIKISHLNPKPEVKRLIEERALAGARV